MEKTTYLILAAGEGKRVLAKEPKPILTLCGSPLLASILESISKSSQETIDVGIIVGKHSEIIQIKLDSELKKFKNITVCYIHQPEPLGTGHAVRCALESDFGLATTQRNDRIIILSGDSPLISNALLTAITNTEGNAPLLVTTELENPTGYGRVIRSTAGNLIKITEEKDATDLEKTIKEVSVSIYSFPAQLLSAEVKKINNHNAQKEYYLTDVIESSLQSTPLKTLLWKNNEDLLGINTPLERANVESILQNRIINLHLQNGVQIFNRNTVKIDRNVTIEKGAQIGPGVILEGFTSIGEEAIIGPNCVIQNSIIEKGAEIKANTVITSSTVHESAKVGPSAHLRPESIIKAHAKVGNFVEIKKSTIGSFTSVAHLSYVGDAIIGEHCNIGCGFITCNYDGRTINGSRKHVTQIGNNVFIGSGCQVIAPITIADGVFIASGSTITENCAQDDFAIAREKQITKSGYARKYQQK